MKITFSIPDELYEKYQAQAERKTRNGVADEILERLERFADIPADQRAICVVGDTRRELETVFQTTVNSPEDLVTKVKRLCTVKIGPCERSLTAGELVTLQTQAQFMGLPPDQYLLHFVNRVIDESLGRI